MLRSGHSMVRAGCVQAWSIVCTDFRSITLAEMGIYNEQHAALVVPEMKVDAAG